MAGHSKWKTTKHYKAATDAKRGALFTKLIREITVAAKAGGGDPDGNPRLRTAIENARKVSCPKDNIERGIKKGTGELEGVDYAEVLYEAYAPGGVALMIQALTDNPTRTVADIRYKLSRNGGNLGSTNSVSYLFDRKGRMSLATEGLDEDTVMMAALEAGAEDVTRDGEDYLITTAPADLHAVREAMETAQYAVREAALSWVPQTSVKVEGENATALLKLLDALDDLDDVQNIDANFEMDEDALAEA